MTNTGQIFLKKMATSLEKGTVQYFFTGEDQEKILVNDFLGQRVTLRFLKEIRCLHCARVIKKTFHQGYCYPCFTRLAACDTCMTRPETCHYHQGTCREPRWGEEHCLRPHVIYLAETSHLKVGITRETRIPTRWIDQGALQVRVIAEVSERLHAGLLETELKKYFSDKTSWSKMLKKDSRELDLESEVAQVTELPQLLREFSGKLRGDSLTINYPIIHPPAKVKSLKLEKEEEISGVLWGIKGQYLIFDHGVFNVRQHSGYRVKCVVEAV